MASKKQLEAAAATARLFTQAEGQEPQEKQAKTRQREQAPEPKRETATFSVKIDSEVLRKWRAYTSLDGYGDKGKLTEAAIVEYMNRHKLTGEKQAKFEKLISI